jgi:protein phosphatase
MELFPGDVLISSSDGLTDLALGHDILGCARQGLASGGVQNACNLLVKMANDRGGHDNITVQMARVTEVGPKHSTIVGAPVAQAQAPVSRRDGVPVTAPGQTPSPYAAAQATPPAGPIAMPPTADWTGGGHPHDMTEMGTEIMGPLPSQSPGRDAAPMSARYGAATPNGGPPPAAGGLPVAPPAGHPVHAAQAHAARVSPTQNFEAYRNGGQQALPLPPQSQRQPMSVTAAPAPAAATMPYAAPFAPLAPNAGGSSRGGLFFLIIGGSAAIAIIVLIILWAVLK